MSDSCGRARRFLWPDAGPRPADEETLAARRHADTCSECRTFFAQMQAAKTAVRATAAGDVTPIELREEIYASLAEARQVRRSRRWSGPLLAVAVAVVLLLGAVLYLRPDSPMGSLVSTISAEHAKAVGGDRVLSSDRGEIERWLAARVAFAVRVPVFTGARLTGARICLTEEGRGAIVEYVVGDRSVSYFVLPSPSGAPPTRAGLTHAAESGYRIVVWRDTGLVHALVGALSHEQLDRLAKECIEQALRLAQTIASGSFATT
jgi:anti-sigma factor RsiW